MVSLDEIARDPARAALVPPADRNLLIARCAAIVMALTCTTTVDTAVNQSSEHTAAAAKGDQLLTIEEVADRLKLSRARIYEMVRAGQIPAARCGRYWRVRPTEVERFIAKNEGIRR